MTNSATHATTHTTQQDFAEKLAMVVEHPLCPVDLRNAVGDWWEEYKCDHEPPITPEGDAAEIRKLLPDMLSADDDELEAA